MSKQDAMRGVRIDAEFAANIEDALRYCGGTGRAIPLRQSGRTEEPMKIHMNSCPKHPSQFGLTTLTHCYCRVHHEATLSELLYEMADEVERMPHGSEYGTQLLGAIRERYANDFLPPIHEPHAHGCTCPECEPDMHSEKWMDTP